MLSCKEVSVLLSRSCDQRLAWRTRLAVRLHLLYCRGCARLEKQLHFLHRALQHLTQTPLLPATNKLPESARRRILETIRRA